MTILGPDRIDPDDAAALVAVIAGAAAAGDARAAQWILEHHPKHRELWTDEAAVKRAVDRSQWRTLDAIQASVTLNTDQKRELFLRLAAACEHPAPQTVTDP